MARECGDCYWAEIKMISSNGEHEWRCKKRHRRVEFDSPGCSEFQSSEKNTCEFCEYYEGGSWRWSTSGTCRLKGVKRSQDNVACGSYYEG